MKIRNAAALAAALAAAACSSPGGAPGTPAAADGRGGTTAAADPAAGKGDPAAKGAGGDLALPGGGRSLLYQRIESLSKAWQVASTTSGEGALADSNAAQTAIGREVWQAMDTVLADVEKSENPRWRVTAAKGLGFVNDPRARPALERTLGSADVRLLSAALVSLGRIGSPETEDAPVAVLLRHPDPVVRGNAALCLARIFQSRRQQGLAPLSPSDRLEDVEADLTVLLFEKDDPIVRANAAQALGGLGTPGAEDALLNRLRDEASLVRLKSAQALALTGTARAEAPLLDALGREPEGNVKTMMALALGSLAERQGRTPPHAELGTDAARWRGWLQR
ncbi:MAG: HEAT repeat domain-containing protein [Planctomycetes bacterium]|nr:HEAT repeat domain-containing protein [Planctomycetota bacterium]